MQAWRGEGHVDGLSGVLLRSCRPVQCSGRGTRTQNLTSRRASNGCFCCPKSGTQARRSRCTAGASIRASLALSERPRPTQDGSRCAVLPRLSCRGKNAHVIVLYNGLWCFSEQEKHSFVIPSMCAVCPCVFSRNSCGFNFYQTPPYHSTTWPVLEPLWLQGRREPIFPRPVRKMQCRTFVSERDTGSPPHKLIELGK